MTTSQRWYRMILLLMVPVVSRLFLLADASSDDSPVVVDAVSKKHGFFLSPDDLTALEERDVYQHQDIMGKANIGTVIQNIQAPPDQVWKTLLEFEKYPQRIAKVSKMESYQQEPDIVTTGRNQAQIRFEKMTTRLRFSFHSYSFFIRFNIMEHPHHYELSWTLDPSGGEEEQDGTKSSPQLLDECSGYWQVHRHPSRDGWTQVIYHIQLTLVESNVPPFVENFIRKHGLDEATGWLKVVSESLVATHATTEESTSSHPTGSCSGGNEEACTISDSLDPREPPPIGISRFFLVSAVWGLLLFNTYLYYSHYR